MLLDSSQHSAFCMNCLYYLIFCCIPNQPLCVSEGYIARCCPVSLVIRNDFHLPMLEGPHTGVGGPQVYAHCISLGHGAGW